MNKTGSNQIVFESIERVPITEVVAEKILSLIKNGSLTVGDKLPSQRELGDMLKVSRASLREALSGLIMMGYLEARAGQGFFVKSTQIEQKPDFSPLEKLGSNDPIRDLYVARALVEPKIAALAAKMANEDDIKQLYEYIKLIEKSPANQFIENGVKFHLQIALVAKNSVLFQVENLLVSLFIEYSPLIFSDSITRERDSTSHIKIVRMIEDGDSLGAMAAALEHLQYYAKDFGLEDSITL